ncbi:MAG: hypothetical protein U1C57_01920 [Candidatus Doudnabacteria bacterium]|nr:hypothetical protein [Desulfobacterales bacterium]MDZ4243841.1 hypothetical protein [Candidatus Doudnabacteria bacterium]
MEKHPTDIRVAIVALDRLNSLPGYFLIMGDDTQSDPTKIQDRLAGINRPPLLKFIIEQSFTSTTEMFDSLISLEPEYRYNTIYTEPPDINQVPSGFILRLHGAVNASIPWVRHGPALYADDPAEGVSLLDDWAGRYSFPKDSVIRRQLRDLGPDNFEDKFYAFTALRYLLAGFKFEKSERIENVAMARMAAQIKIIPKLDPASKSAAKEFRHIQEHLMDEQHFGRWWG